MSGSKQITVSRDYRPQPGAMAEALELLLKTPVNQEGGPPTAPENAKEGINDDFRATPNNSR